MTDTKASHSKAAGKSEDAIAALIADHKKVKALFTEFKKLKEQDGAQQQKADLVSQICMELKVHAEIEEEVFYPAVRKQIHDDDLMDEALVEHASAKDLIAQLEEMDPQDDLYDAKVTVLGEQIDHHVEEEEGEMFPKAKKAKVNTPELAAQLAERRAAVQEALGPEDESGSETGARGSKSSRADKGMRST